MPPLTELGHSRQGQPNETEGGSEMGKQSSCWDGESKFYHSDVKCSYLPRGTYTDNGEMALYPLKQPSKNDSQVKTIEHEAVLLQRMGGVHTDPLKPII